MLIIVIYSTKTNKILYHSDIRHIPDHQEVFADASTDESIIIELLEHVPAPSTAAAAAIHWSELAYFNDAEEANSAIIFQKELVAGEGTCVIIT